MKPRALLWLLLLPVALLAGIEVSAQPLTLLHPRGGETLLAGRRSAFIFGNSAASDSFRIDYSTNGGVDWNLVTEKNLGGVYDWTVPSTISENCVARVTQIYDGRVLRRIDEAQMPFIVTLSPDGSQLLTTYTSNTDTVKAPIVRRASDGQILFLLSGHTKSVREGFFSRDGKYIVTASFDSTIRIWRSSTGEHVKTIVVPATVYSATIDPTSTRLVVGLYQGHVLLYDIETGKQIKRWDSPEDVLANSLRYDPTGQYIIGGIGNRLMLFTKDLDSVRIYARQSAYIRKAIFDNSGSSIISAGLNGELKIWSTTSTDSLGMYPLSLTSLIDVAMSPDGEFLATGSTDGTVKLWNVKERSFVNFIGRSLDPMASVNTVSYTPDGSQIVVRLDGDIAFIDASAPPYRSALSAPWKILEPTILGRDVDIGHVYYGQVKEGVFTQFIVNNDTIPLTIKSITMKGALASSFEILSPTTPFKLQAHGSASLRYRFTPGAGGPQNGFLIVSDGDETRANNAHVRVAAPAFELQSSGVFSPTLPGSFTERTLWIRNVDDVPHAVNQLVIKGDNASDFRITATPTFDTVIESGDSLAATLRFIPSAIGNRTAWLELMADGEAIPFRWNVTGFGGEKSGVAEASWQPLRIIPGAVIISCKARHVAVYDLLGRMHTCAWHVLANDEIEVATHSLNPGRYFLRLYDGDSTHTLALEVLR